MNHKMRRFRQQLDRNAIEKILMEGTNGVLALDGDNGYPYAVPISYVWCGDYIYFHSAKAGHKIDAIRRNPKASFCVVAKDDIKPEEFTTYFRSVIAFGTIEIIDNKDEKIEGLKILSDKYSPSVDPTAEIDRFINNVLILKFHIEEITGKQAKELIA